MGLTPLEGLIMGTRSGDIDPALHFFMLRETGMSADELEKSLNSQGGLKGICGLNDMREIIDQAGKGNDSAKLAIEMSLLPHQKIYRRVCSCARQSRRPCIHRWHR